jgi:hypothetical protein
MTKSKLPIAIMIISGITFTSISVGYIHGTPEGFLTFGLFTLFFGVFIGLMSFFEGKI